MKLIKQKYKGDCSVASFAMFLDISYDDVVQHYEEELKEKFVGGVYNHRDYEVASEYNVELVTIHENFDFSKPCLIIAPSLNAERGKFLHMIYWDGKKIWDPSRKKRYNKIPKKIEYIHQKLRD